MLRLPFRFRALGVHGPILFVESDREDSWILGWWCERIAERWSDWHSPFLVFSDPFLDKCWWWRVNDMPNTTPINIRSKHLQGSLDLTTIDWGHLIASSNRWIDPSVFNKLEHIPIRLRMMSSEMCKLKISSFPCGIWRFYYICNQGECARRTWEDLSALSAFNDFFDDFFHSPNTQRRGIREPHRRSVSLSLRTWALDMSPWDSWELINTQDFLASLGWSSSAVTDGFINHEASFHFFVHFFHAPRQIYSKALKIGKVRNSSFHPSVLMRVTYDFLCTCFERVSSQERTKPFGKALAIHEDLLAFLSPSSCALQFTVRLFSSCFWPTRVE